MHNQEMSTYKQGILYTAGSYLLWGILPLYWKMLEHVSPEEILAHRILWSFLFMILLLTFTKEWKSSFVTIKRMIKKPMLIISLIVSSLLISINWFVYIWAVNNEHMVEASLGYYINPLISVFLGMIFLKEKLTLWQKISFLLATLGVLITTLHYGGIPWVALTLAISFGLYGLTKKVTKLSSVMGLTFETMVVTPLAAVYLLSLINKGESSFVDYQLATNLLLIGAGVATAIPLLLFASGARRIPLFMVGVLQYIAPSITLVIGIVIYHEPFTNIEFITFSLIWSSLFLFSLSHSRYFKSAEFKEKRAS
ncbi:EamA family transporter RarD [Metabacillus herbersteinensis]|uniref:EamA family transporter RarD n=1 Tax=Metabacillus herbersteinensis TaxID=283816 RepID=A0ABV6GMG5_9BACI